jgi:hypothetical protein
MPETDIERETNRRLPLDLGELSTCITIEKFLLMRRRLVNSMRMIAFTVPFRTSPEQMGAARASPGSVDWMRCSQGAERPSHPADI